jgi:hypothetical protein
MTLENEGHTYRWPEPKDPGIIEFGRVVVTETEIEVSGWHVRDMTVPELRAYAIKWAEDRLADAVEVIAS